MYKFQRFQKRNKKEARDTKNNKRLLHYYFQPISSGHGQGNANSLNQMMVNHLAQIIT